MSSCTFRYAQGQRFSAAAFSTSVMVCGIIVKFREVEWKYKVKKAIEGVTVERKRFFSRTCRLMRANNWRTFSTRLLRLLLPQMKVNKDFVVWKYRIDLHSMTSGLTTAKQFHALCFLNGSRNILSTFSLHSSYKCFVVYFLLYTWTEPAGDKPQRWPARLGSLSSKNKKKKKKRKQGAKI